MCVAGKNLDDVRADLHEILAQMVDGIGMVDDHFRYERTAVHGRKAEPFCSLGRKVCTKYELSTWFYRAFAAALYILFNSIEQVRVAILGIFACLRITSLSYVARV